MGCVRLGLKDGEPLARRDLFDIIDSATESGQPPCLTTNGLFIDEAIARAFGRRNLVWLNGSLDGASTRGTRQLRLLGPLTHT